MRRVAWLVVIAVVVAACGTARSADGRRGSADGQRGSADGQRGSAGGPCGVSAASAGVRVARVKVGFRHGESSIDKLLALADGSFIVVGAATRPPGPFGRGTPDAYYEYRIDAAGRPLEERHDWRGAMAGSPIDLTYFFAGGPGSPLMWRDAAGVTRRLPGDPVGIPFRDRHGRFWRLVHGNAFSDLFVSADLRGARRKVDLGGEEVAGAAAGCDGAVWALARTGRVWRIAPGDDTARVVASLPRGTGVFGAKPYDDGYFTAMADGSVWLATRRDDPTMPWAEGYREHVLHLGARGLIEELPRGVAEKFAVSSEGPDGALWAGTASGLLRLGAHDSVRSYPIAGFTPGPAAPTLGRRLRRWAPAAGSGSPADRVSAI